MTDHHFKGGLAYKFYDEEYDSRLDLFINAIGADILTNDDYIELDDIVL